MTPPRRLFQPFPFRVHGPRVAMLAGIADDRPALTTIAAQRHACALLNRLRLRAISRVQLRSRDADEPFLTRVDVALDHAGRIRAVLAAAQRPLPFRTGSSTAPRGLRLTRSPPVQRRASTLRWRLRPIDLPPIDHAAIEARGFARQAEPSLLHSVGCDAAGRPMYLVAAAARAFIAMRSAAEGEGVELWPISTFRSVAYQRGLIARKLKRGDSLDAILRVNAAPGYSEHHSGRAIDIGTPGCAALDEAFERTPAFAWLQQHAATFGFRLSYPRDNTLGVIYEPWHWYYVGSCLGVH